MWGKTLLFCIHLQLYILKVKNVILEAHKFTTQEIFNEVRDTCYLLKTDVGYFLQNLMK